MAKLQGHVLKETISEDFSESRISILTNFVFEQTKFSNIGENINSLFAGFTTFKFGHVKGFPSNKNFLWIGTIPQRSLWPAIFNWKPKNHKFGFTIFF